MADTTSLAFVDVEGNPIIAGLQAFVTDQGLNPLASGFLQVGGTLACDIANGTLCVATFLGRRAPKGVVYFTASDATQTVTVPGYASAVADADGYVTRQTRNWPRGWFGDAAKASGGGAYPIAAGAAAELLDLSEQNQGTILNARGQSSVGADVDLWVQDYFGDSLPRNAGESDAAYIARAQTLLAIKQGTPEGVQTVADFYGDAFLDEPWRAAETGAYDVNGTLAYDGIGGYGSQEPELSVFVQSPNLYPDSDTLASSTATDGSVTDGVFTTSATDGSLALTADVTPGTPYTFSGEVSAPSGGVGVVQSAKSTPHALTANFTLAANPVVGNLLVVEMLFSYGTFTPPSGWTVVDNVPPVSGPPWGVVTLYRVVQSGDTKTSWASSFGTFSTTSYAVVAAYELSGVDTVSPINGHSYFTHSAPTTVVLPTVTPTVSGCLALSLGSIYTAAPTAPTGFTSDQSGSWGGGNYNAAHEASVPLSAVAPNWGSATSLGGSAVLLVLSPAQSRISVKDTSGTLLASQTSGASRTSLTWTPLSGVTEAVFSYEQNGASGTGTFQKPMLRVDGVSEPYTSDQVNARVKAAILAARPLGLATNVFAVNLNSSQLIANKL